jgi:hypothetical protein
MPEILVTTTAADEPDHVILMRERVCRSDLESGHFRGQLVERINWAVADAHQAERGTAALEASPSGGRRDRVANSEGQSAN